MPSFSDLTDLVFKDRNKVYGAYVLRKEYSKNMSIAFLISTLLVVGILIIPFLSFENKSDEYMMTDVILHTPPAMRLPSFPEKTVKPADLSKEKNQEKETERKKENTDKPKVTKDDTKEPEPTKKDPKTEGVSENDSSNAMNSDSLLGSTSTDGEGDLVVDFADIMPQFPGGHGALLRFLSSKLIYPLPAHQNRIEGIVVIGFVIDKNGRLRNPKVIQSLYPACDEEALRVIRLIPDWIPAKNQGRNVSINFRMPIEFKLARK